MGNFCWTKLTTYLSKAMVLFLLFESASGFGIFEHVKTDEVSITSEEVQESIQDLQRFSKIIKLKSFLPFTSAEKALENINATPPSSAAPSPRTRGASAAIWPTSAVWLAALTASTIRRRRRSA